MSKKSLLKKNILYFCFNLYLVPAKFIPCERHIVSNSKWSIFIENGQFTAAARSSRQPNNNGVLLAIPRLKEQVEHPTITKQPPSVKSHERVA